MRCGKELHHEMVFMPRIVFGLHGMRIHIRRFYPTPHLSLLLSLKTAWANVGKRVSISLRIRFNRPLSRVR